MSDAPWSSRAQRCGDELSEIAFEKPFAEFKSLLDEAWKTEPNDANAMTLATVGESGRPASRIVLLKDVDERGFVFYTNTESRKGRDLAAHPFAALGFHWKTRSRNERKSVFCAARPGLFFVPPPHIC